VRGRIELLHVIDPQHRAAGIKDHERRSEIWSHTLRDHGIHVNWTLLYGPPDQVILAHAAELKASLIVLGSNRSGNQETAPLDQVTIDIIRKARCPVLTVPSGG
jgi:nucleotide-binding universal stress UspA family protein